MAKSVAPSGTEPAVLLATVASGAMIAQQVAGKATRDALFLAQFSVARLPWMMGLGALLSFFAAIVGARALTRYGPERVVRGAFLLGAVAFAVEFAVSFFSKAKLAIVVYLHIALFGAPLISLFWSLVNERFDPHTAKRAIARIAAGGTLGGVVGGLIGWQIAGLTTARANLAVLALLNVTSLVAVSRVNGAVRELAQPGGASSRPPTIEDALEGPPRLHDSERYLLVLAAMVALVAAMEALVDWTFAARATRSMHDSRELLAFFSGFHAVVAVLAFFAQSLLGRRVIERAGIGVAMAVLPLTVVTFGGLALAVPRLFSAVLLRGSESVVSNSLFRSGYELLYTPIQQTKKRSMKTLVDIGSDRLGTLLGSAVIPILLMISSDAEPLVVLLAIALGCVGIVVARALQRGYVGALEESLRNGTEHANAEAPRVEVSESAGGTLPEVVRLSEDGLVAAIRDLRSGDRGRIERALASCRDAPQLGPFVIPLLARDDVRKLAFEWLWGLDGRLTGQLVDALLDARVPPLARRRVARLLRTMPSQRVADALVRGLSDPQFEVRYECGISLVRVVEKDPKISIARTPILEAVPRELAAERALVAEQVADEDEEERPFGAALGDRASRGLEHVFTILSLMLDREPLRIAWRALETDDPNLRGTALEYLENVLPPEIRDALWPYLRRAAAPTSPRRRSREEILRDLVRAEGLVATALAALIPARKSHA